MNHLVLLVFFTILGFVLHGVRRLGQFPVPAAAAWVSWLVALYLLGATSFVIIDQDRIGHLKRVYFGSDMPAGQIIALEGQKGPQAEILGPGFHLIVRGPEPPALSERAAEVLARVQGSLVCIGPELDVEEAYARWLDRKGRDAVLVRPDHVVFGSASGPDAASALLEALGGFLNPRAR